MALKLDTTNLGFQTQLRPAFSFTLRPSTVSLKSQRLRWRRLSSFACRSALVDQQEQQIPFTEHENSLIEALIGIQGRGRSASTQQLNDVEKAVRVLEGLEGVPNPTSSSSIEGRWQLMFTTRPGTASPIQRTFVGVDNFSVFQDVYLRTNDPRVSNIVRFSEAIGELKVEAAASIADGKRVLFRFDRAAFSFKFLPFKVPYPVPFKLLGEEAKGWLDTTYLSQSGNIRISRGNKGTTFVLQKKTDPRQRLLSAISTGIQVEEEIDKFISSNENTTEAQPELQEGQWQMIWSSQSETDSWLENAANGLMGKQIISKNGQIKFVVDILPGFRFSMNGKFEKSGTAYELTMDDAAIIGGPFGYPLELENKFDVEILYSDNKIRISRGYKKFMFVHDVEKAVRVLEGLEGVSNPTGSSSIEGRWQLMFTTRPGTASPIQRTFVGVDNFSVFQDVYLRTNDPRVSNIVRFSEAIGELKVECGFQFRSKIFSTKFSVQCVCLK